jgi:hypothetical protein
MSSLQGSVQTADGDSIDKVAPEIVKSDVSGATFSI